MKYIHEHEADESEADAGEADAGEADADDAYPNQKDITDEQVY